MLVYRYGLLRPNKNADLVSEQMVLAHRYRNKLIEIERARRDAIREILSATVERERKVYLDARDALRDAEDAIKAQRSSTRSRSDTAAQRDKIKRLRAKKDEALAILSSAQTAVKKDDNIKARMKEADQHARDDAKKAQKESGVFWGTYLIVDRAMDQSRKMPLWDKHGEPNNPMFLRWDGEGSVAVQIQLPQQIPSTKILEGKSNSIQLDMEPLFPPDAPVSNTRRKMRRGALRLRVGSEGRAPIWAEWPIVMHRPLPPESIIAWAIVTKKKIADREEWSLHLTLKNTEGARGECGNGTVAVDVGWRKLEDGSLRVAYLLDDHGHEEEIRLHPRIISGLRKVDDLQSIRQKNQNEAIQSLMEWKKRQDAIPDWFAIKTSHIYQWESPARLAALLREWSNKRWDGDETGFNILEDWHYGVYDANLGRRDGGDRHLWQWQENQRKKSMRRRKDQYRSLGARLSRRYSTMVIEDFKLINLQMHELPESDKVENKGARWQQRAAACYELFNTLIHAFESRGGRVIKVDPAMTTQRCFDCGHEGRWDAAPDIMHTCEACGRTWDQDANASRNIMKIYKDTPPSERSGGKKKATAKSLTKWSKKKSKNRTTRKPADNNQELQY